MGNWGLTDWDDVRVFLAVVRHGSFTKAGEALSMRQSTVGRRIQSLEARLGAKLFDRTATGMRPTPAARSVLRKAEAMEGHALSLERRLVGTDTELQGSVNLSGTEAVIAHWLLPRFYSMMVRLPNIRLNLQVTTNTLDLASRETDIALRFGAPEDPRLVARKLGIIRFAFFASQDYAETYGLPRTFAEVFDHCMLDNTGYHKSDTEGIWSDFIARHEHVPLRASSTLPYAAAIRASIGIGAMPTFMRDAMPELLQLDIPFDFKMTLFLVTHEETRHNARIRAVADEIYALAAEDRRKWFS